MVNTIVYIDGLNLYYRALRNTPHKWLNIEALSIAALPSNAVITRVNYYTANVSGRADPNAPARQHAFLRALATLPLVRVHYGNFLVSEKWAALVNPIDNFRPSPAVAYILKTEEKGSDVNLGVHLVRDAFTGQFQQAAVLSNDTDLVEAIRIVTQEVGLPVTLLSPGNNPATSLARVSTSVRHIRPYLGPCAFPNPVMLPKGKQVHKPPTW
jgi:uncharacterized LabA/DUF88 family protein